MTMALNPMINHSQLPLLRRSSTSSVKYWYKSVVTVVVVRCDVLLVLVLVPVVVVAEYVVVDGVFRVVATSVRLHVVVPLVSV
jgi:hypothetical protein